MINNLLYTFDIHSISDSLIAFPLQLGHSPFLLSQSVKHLYIYYLITAIPIMKVMITLELFDFITNFDPTQAYSAYLILIHCDITLSDFLALNLFNLIIGQPTISLLE
jgi:hypothetical protein